MNKESKTEVVAQKKKKSMLMEIWEWIYTLIIAIAIAFLIKGFLFDIVQVDGLSMFPTLNDNDRLIVTKLGYEPVQGDIIILDSTYKSRTSYYDNMAKVDGKDEYGLMTKLVKYPMLPKALKHKYYVKRVIALPGQTVDIKDGKVYVDNKALDEPYYNGTTSQMDPSMKFPLTVDDGFVFVMGDNRNHSKDSRDSSLGQVPYKAVLGKSSFRVFPFTKVGTTK